MARSRQRRSDPAGVLLCVHGNPTWSYLWRRLLASAPPGWRVVAPDQLGMGWSERLTSPRTLPQRVADLGDLTSALGITGPVVTVGHDWGGIISLGWALAHRDQLRGVVLTNTAIAQPADDRAQSSFGWPIRASCARPSPCAPRLRDGRDYRRGRRSPQPSAGPSPLRTARPTDGSPWATSSPTSPRHRPPVPRGPRRHRGGDSLGRRACATSVGTARPGLRRQVLG